MYNYICSEIGSSCSSKYLKFDHQHHLLLNETIVNDKCQFMSISKSIMFVCGPSIKESLHKQKKLNTRKNDDVNQY